MSIQRWTPKRPQSPKWQTTQTQSILRLDQTMGRATIVEERVHRSTVGYGFASFCLNPPPCQSPVSDPPTVSWWHLHPALTPVPARSPPLTWGNQTLNMFRLLPVCYPPLCQTSVSIPPTTRQELIIDFIRIPLHPVLLPDLSQPPVVLEGINQRSQWGVCIGIGFVLSDSPTSDPLQTNKPGRLVIGLI